MTHQIGQGPTRSRRGILQRPVSLLVKVYFWFLLAMTLMLLATMAIGKHSAEQTWDQRAQRWSKNRLQFTRDMIQFWLAQGKETQEVGAALQKKYADEIISLAIVTADGRELFRFPPTAVDPLPSRAQREQVVQHGEYIFHRSHEPSMVGLPIELPNQVTAVFFAKMSNDLVFTPSRIRVAVIMLTILFVAWLLCWPLARHLTNPLRQLSTAAEELGTGNLSARINMQRGDEIGRLANRFNQMAQRLQQLVQGHKRLLGDISHELRSPLARLQLALELARQDGGDKPSPFIGRAEKQADELDGLIGELLKYSRLEVKPYELEMEVVDVAKVIGVVVATYKEEAAREAVKLRVVVADDVSTVQADPKLLVRALGNLVANALAHSPREAQVNISAQQQGDILELQVKDQGPGVPAEMLEKLFEPFFRADSSRERTSGGVGLGLAIVRQCMLAHEGDARANLVRPHGLLVTLTLPTGTGSDPPT